MENSQGPCITFTGQSTQIIQQNCEALINMVVTALNVGGVPSQIQFLFHVRTRRILNIIYALLHIKR